MKRINFKLLLTGVLVGLLLFNSYLPMAAQPNQTKNSEELERKIVVFEEKILNEAAQEKIIKKFGGVKIKHLRLINGMVVLLPPKAEAALSKEKGIKKIEEDLVVKVLKPFTSLSKKVSTQPPESLPWGVDRIDADLAWYISRGNGVKVAIMDTGIDLAHPDLTERIKEGYNAINPRKSPNDDNGHGTHVAGIVAASDNEIGVVGVAPEANLYPIKVLNSQGKGYLSDVIEGLEWAVSKKIQVVNMSFGASTSSKAFEEAILRASEAGVLMIAAAGNNAGGSVSYPAAYPEVIAVSATDSLDNLAFFSSIGPEIDLAAPGVGILSTYKNSRYATLSGTSMAAPHVTGAVAEVLASSVNPLYDFNGNNQWDPLEVETLLKNKADDLGSLGFDFYFGYGLVDVEESVTGNQTNP